MNVYTLFMTILNLRLIISCERHLEVQKDVFLRLRKGIRLSLTWTTHTVSKWDWVDGKGIQIIRNLYWGQTAWVRIMNEMSDEIGIQRGVRQGCVASRTLFNLYTILKQKCHATSTKKVIHHETMPYHKYTSPTLPDESVCKFMQSPVINSSHGKKALLIKMTKKNHPSMYIIVCQTFKDQWMHMVDLLEVGLTCERGNSKGYYI